MSSVSWMSRYSEDRNSGQLFKDVCLGRVRKSKELVAIGKLSREVFMVLFCIVLKAGATCFTLV